MRATFSLSDLLFVGMGLLLPTFPFHGLEAAELLPPGFRPLPHGTHALVGGRVVPRPGQVWDKATVVIREGLIVEAGPDAEPPPEARVWDMTGHTLYAGFIDAHATLGDTRDIVANRYEEPVHGDTSTLGSGRIRFFGVATEEQDPGRSGPGSELELVQPEYRVADHYAPSGKDLEAMRTLGFAAANVVPGDGILRGRSALVTLSDVDPNEAVVRGEVFQHVAFVEEGRSRDSYPSSLMGAVAVIRQSLLDSQFQIADQAHYQAHPQGRTRPVYHPARTALAPVLAGRMPIAMEPGSAILVERASLIAREFDLPHHMISSGEEWRRPDLAKATGAPFVVPLNFPEIPKLPDPEDWDQVSLNQLRAWDWAPENPAVLRRQGLTVALSTHGLHDLKKFRKNLRLAVDRGLSEEDALAGLTTVPAQLCGVADRLGTIEAGKVAHLVVVEGDTYFKPDNRVKAVWIDGRIYPVDPGAKETSPNRPAAQAEAPPPDASKRLARAPSEGRGPLSEPNALLIRKASIWTCGPEGRLEEADLLVVQGRIQQVGRDLAIPPDLKEDLLVLDRPGTHVTPGLIDAHNHSMVLGRVNEPTLPSSAMVRVGDVINSETIKIRQQLAGGLTAANLLHGSANPIGGQNALIKLRDGASPEGLKFQGAPAGIKFALGENVKQSNWGEKYTRRFPQTRMGVPTFMANRFTAAEQYLAAWQARGPNDPPLRRDLELDTLGEILRGQRWIHCHSYRQDEILALLRMAEQFDIRIGVLQHILEGYKVADEIARHGAAASAFSDWWAYKVEVYDAIPYAGALMHERGVLVSFNSDSSDHARRLHLEAAKAVKYGGVPEEEALKFVTLNPAKQLGVSDRVGSLEPGKDADFVIWSHAPLDSRTLCLETWIEGRKYYDRAQEEERTRQRREERTALLAKAKKAAATKKADPLDDSGDGGRFWRTGLEHQFDQTDRHCLDEE